jgi:hypothetical protein
MKLWLAAQLPPALARWINDHGPGLATIEDNLSFVPQWQPPAAGDTHSPRLYQGQLYLLDSGHGSLIRLDPLSGQHSTIASLPGFPCGLDCFAGYGFVGLSQIRKLRCLTACRYSTTVTTCVVA